MTVSFTTRLIALIAGFGFAAPTAALPCFSAACDHQDDQEQAVSGCCGDCPDEAPESPSTGPHGSDGPCDCPPGCPAACGSGKLPCPPADQVLVGNAPIPVSRPLDLYDAVPLHPATGDVFRPPRI